MYEIFCRTTVHRAAESKGRSMSWHRGDRDESLIYWVHFLVRRFLLHAHTLTHTHALLPALGPAERNKRYGAGKELS